jgi:hypothetical protein
MTTDKKKKPLIPPPRPLAPAPLCFPKKILVNEILSNLIVQTELSGFDCYSHSEFTTFRLFFICNKNYLRYFLKDWGII